MAKKVVSTILLVCMFVASLAACAPKTAEVPSDASPVEEAQPATEEEAAPAEEAEPVEEVEEAEEPFELVYGAPYDVKTLDPMLSNNRLDMSVLMHIFDFLGRRDKSGVTQPDLAESWEQVEPTVWEFKLKEGITFSNGEALTSEDVAYSMERAQDPQFNNFYQLPSQTTLKEVKIIDDYTFQFVTEEPSLTMPFWVAEALIIPKDYYSSLSVDEVAEAPVGSGPYVFTEWVKDDHITLERNENYWGDAAAVDKITFRVIPEQSARLNELLAGNIDIAPSVSLDQAGMVESDVSRLIAMEGLRKMNFQISQTGTQEALKDKKVRQALNYAVDKATITETILSGFTSPLQSYVNPPNNNPDLEPYSYNPELAKQLLAEAGYADGFEVTIQARPNTYGLDKEIVLAVADYLQAVGVSSKIEFVEQGQFYEALDNKEFKGLAFVGWAALVNPLVENLILTCGHIDNGSSYCNPDLDALYDEASVTLDPEARQELVLQMQELVWDDAPWIFLWKLPVLFGVSNRIEWEPRNDGYINTWEAAPAN
ncbi:MAG: ABC transporter substrate-binding protein [Anaerolineaceae bacterium]|jgi:peptide/nickel transport system substrate-binding protein|nr:ABC transporter substrate-binding protein [Anaerolineaceae bacterium]